jgi:hypothetical protein
MLVRPRRARRHLQVERTITKPLRCVYQHNCGNGGGFPIFRQPVLEATDRTSADLHRLGPTKRNCLCDQGFGLAVGKASRLLP